MARRRHNPRNPQRRERTGSTRARQRPSAAAVHDKLHAPSFQIPALSGKVVIGDESSGVITADRIDLWLSSRDVDPPAATGAAFASAVPFVNGTNSGAATQTSLPIAVGVPSFGLLVPVNPQAGQIATFSGYLIVSATWDHPRKGRTKRVTKAARLPIQLSAAASSPYRVVVMHPTAGARYLWAAPELVRSDPAAPRTGKGSITIQLRDQTNHRAHYRAVFSVGTHGRPKLDNADDVVFGVPLDVPSLVRIAAGDGGATLASILLVAPSRALRHLFLQGRVYLPRADLKTFDAASRTSTPVAIPLTATSATTQVLAGKTVVLDPGHGVNYEFRSQARVYEWYVAHRVMRATGSLLQTLGATVVLVPTARFQTQHVRIAVALSGVTAADGVYQHPHVRLHIDRATTPHRFEIEVVDRTLSVASLGAALGYNEDANRDPTLLVGKAEQSSGVSKSSGANRLRSGGDDGVLTALEVADLDLAGTELAVLSACETGVRVVQNGEGVYGLRRALVLAGVRTQVASLWKVDDAATKDLMIDYYRRLQAGAGRSQALREAQLTMLRDAARSHPYYWASFIAIGEQKALDR